MNTNDIALIIAIEEFFLDSEVSVLHDLMTDSKEFNKSTDLNVLLKDKGVPYKHISLKFYKFVLQWFGSGQKYSNEALIDIKDKLRTMLFMGVSTNNSFQNKLTVRAGYRRMIDTVSSAMGTSFLDILRDPTNDHTKE